MDAMLLYSTLSTGEANNNEETLDGHEADVEEVDVELHTLDGVGVEQGDVGAISLANDQVAETVDAVDHSDSFASGDDVVVTTGNGDVEPENATKQGNNEEVENVETPLSDDVEDASPKNDAEPAGKKSRKQSKKNRNVKGVLCTLKNKLENIQKEYGGQPNFLLLLEDNFTDLNVTGPKILVTASGDLKNLFMEKNVGYNPERMLVLKEGRKLEPDYSFLDQYISAQLRRTSPIASSSVSSPGNALNESVVGLLESLSSGRKAGRKTGKKKRKRSRSSTEPSSDESDESDTSGESRKHKRKPKTKRRRQSIRKSKKKVPESSSGTSDSDSDDDAETSSDEDDNDPTHGTTQNSTMNKMNKTKPNKKITRHPKARKEKHDILAPKKVLTPGSPDIFASGFGKSTASKTKTKAPSDQLEIQTEKPKAPAAKAKAPAAKSKAPATKPKAPEAKPKTQAPKTKVPGEKPKAPVVKSRPHNRPKAAANKLQPTISDPINTGENPAQCAQAKQLVTQTGTPAELFETRASPTDADGNKDDSWQTLPPSEKVSSWLLDSDGRSGMGTGKPDQPGTWKKPGKKSIDNCKRVSKPNLLAPLVNSKVTLDDPQPGPSGQFKFGRAAKLVQASKNVAKKLFKDSLMTEEEIEEFLDMDKTPTRKKKT